MCSKSQKLRVQRNANKNHYSFKTQKHTSECSLHITFSHTLSYFSISKMTFIQMYSAKLLLESKSIVYSTALPHARSANHSPLPQYNRLVFQS